MVFKKLKIKPNLCDICVPEIEYGDGIGTRGVQKVLQLRYEKLTRHVTHTVIFLWSPYVIGQTVIFSSCFFFLLSSFFFFSSPNLSGRKLDVYHTLAHGVALVRI